MGILRSEPMSRGTMVIPSYRGHEFIDVLGREANVQFEDMNTLSLRRQYKRYIQRIDEMDRILRVLFEEIEKLPGAVIEKGHVESFLESDHLYQLDKVESAMQGLYKHVMQYKENQQTIVSQKNAAIEQRAVAMFAADSLAPGIGDRGGRPEAAGVGQALLGGRDEADVTGLGFGNIAGVVLRSEQDRLSRAIFRATRGNAYVHLEPIPEDVKDESTGKSVLKSVFVVYFQGVAGSSALEEKILRICKAFEVNTYDWPRGNGHAENFIQELSQRIEEQERLENTAQAMFIQEISVVLEPVREKGNSLIEEWRLFCQKERAVYATLDLFEGVDTLRASCWYPTREEEKIRQLLNTRANHAQGEVSAFLLPNDTKTKKPPPTYIRTTEFTAAFQGFVDTYGVPRYQEANPALLTIITLPFLFGIMYGDVGHGGIVMLFGAALVWFWPKLKDSRSEMTQMMGGGRYMIFLMGMYAVYAGFLYNDFFSLGLDMCGTRYDQVGSDDKKLYFKPTSKRTFPYPFGFDPKWKGAENELTFFNSFKMKFAVIVGGVQMTTGVILKAFNAVYFQDWLTFIFEFIPQLVFMLALVGWMDFLIIWKWAAPVSDPKPNIITVIINMFMLTPPDPAMFDGQGTIQNILIILMILSIPTMLLPKPLIRFCIHNAQQKKNPRQIPDVDPEAGKVATDSSEAPRHHEEEEEEEEYNFGEEMIHQMIDTIEFILGTISNTASYLRLWALSLAHQQLSLVFFEKTVKSALEMDLGVGGKGIVVFVIFAAFACITFGVMIGMDTLECYLHALRLQWVEFQNKFYKADGYKFTPFNFYRTLTNADVE